jgi:hypothetical protein
MGSASRKREEVPAVDDEIVGGPGLSDADARLLKELMVEIREERGRLSTAELIEEIVERSRPEESPSHHLYEWDLEKAHSIYLVERTRALIMRVKVVFAEMPDKPTRYVRIVTTEGKRGPLPVREIMQSQDLRSALLEEAREELERWRFRYKLLSKLAELMPVFDAVERFVSKR